MAQITDGWLHFRIQTIGIDVIMEREVQVAQMENLWMLWLGFMKVVFSMRMLQDMDRVFTAHLIQFG